MFRSTVKYSENNTRTMSKIFITIITVMAFVIGMVSGGTAPARAEDFLSDEQATAAIKQVIEESVSQSPIKVAPDSEEARNDSELLSPDSPAVGEKEADDDGTAPDAAKAQSSALDAGKSRPKRDVGPQADVTIGDIRITGIYFDPSPPVSGRPAVITISLRNENPIENLGTNGYLIMNLSQVFGPNISLGQLPVGASVSGNGTILELPLPALSRASAGQVSFSLDFGAGSTGTRLTPIISAIQLPGTSEPITVSNGAGVCLPGVLGAPSVCSVSTSVASSIVSISDLEVPSFSFIPNPPAAGTTATVSIGLRNANTASSIGGTGYAALDVSGLLHDGITLGQLPSGSSLNGNTLQVPLPALGAGQSGQIVFPVNLPPGTAGAPLSLRLAQVELPGQEIPVTVSGPRGVCVSGLLAPGSVCSVSTTVVPTPVGLEDLRVGGITFNPTPPVAGSSATLTISVTNNNAFVGLGANGLITVNLSRVLGNDVTLGQLPAGASLDGNILQLPLPALAAGQPGDVSFQLNFSYGATGAQVNPIIAGIQLPDASDPVPISDVNGVCLPVLNAASTCSANIIVSAAPVGTADIHLGNLRFDPNPPVAGSPSSIVVDVKNTSDILRLATGGFITVDVSRVLVPGISLGQLPSGATIAGTLVRLPLPALNPGQAGQVSFPLIVGHGAINGILSPVLSGIQLPGQTSPTGISGIDGSCLPEVVAGGSSCSTASTVRDPDEVFNVDIRTTAVPSSPKPGDVVTYTVTATPSGFLPVGTTTIWVDASDIINKASIVGGNLQLGVSIQGGSLNGNAIVGGLIPWVFTTVFDSPATLTFRATVNPGVTPGTSLTARTLVAPVDGLTFTSNCGSLLPPPIGAFPSGAGCAGTATVAAPPPVGLGDLQISEVFFAPNPPAAASTAKVNIGVKNTNPSVALGANGSVTVDVSRVLGNGVTLGQLPSGASLNGSILQLPLPALAAGQAGQIAFSLNLGGNTTGLSLMPVLAGIQLPGAGAPAPVSAADGMCLAGILAAGSNCSTSSTVTESAPSAGIRDLQVTGIYFDPAPPVSGSLAKVTVSIRNSSSTGMLRPDGFMTVNLHGVINAGVSLESLPVGASISGNILQLPLPALAAGKAGQMSFLLNLGAETAGIELKPVIDGVQLPGTTTVIPVSDPVGMCLPGILSEGSMCSTDVAIMAPDAVNVEDLYVTDISFDPNPPVAGQSALLNISISNTHGTLDLSAGTVVGISVKELVGDGVSLGVLPSNITLVGDTLNWTLPQVVSGEAASISLPVNFALSAASAQVRPVIASVKLPGDENVVVVDTGGICLSGVLASGSFCSVTATVAAPPVSVSDLQIVDIYFNPNPPVAGASSTVTLNIANMSTTARLGAGGFLTVNVSKLLGPGIALGSLPAGASINGDMLWLPLPSLVSGQAGRISFPLNFEKTTVGVELKPVAAGIQLPGAGAPVNVSDASGECLQGVLAPGSVCSVDATVSAPPVAIKDLQIAGIYFEPNPPVAGGPATITINVKNTNTMIALEAAGFITVDVGKVLSAGVVLGELPLGASITGNMLQLPLPAIGVSQAGQISFPLNLSLSSAGTQLIPVVSSLQLPTDGASTTVSNINGVCLPGVLAAGSICSASATVIAPPVSITDLQISDISFAPELPVAGESTRVTISVGNTNTKVPLKTGGFITVDISKVLGTGISLGTLPTGASVIGNVLRIPLPNLGSGRTAQISFPINLLQSTVGSVLQPVIDGIQLPESLSPQPVTDATGSCLPGVLADGSVCAATATVTEPVVRVNNIQIAGIYFDPSTPVSGSSASITVNVKNTNVLVGLDINALITIDVSNVLLDGITLGQLPEGASIAANILTLPLPTLSANQTGEVSFSIALGQRTNGLQLKPVIDGVQLPGAGVPERVSDDNGVCLPGLLSNNSVCSTVATVAAPPVAVEELRISAISFIPDPPVAGSPALVTVDVVNTNAVVGLGAGAFITLDLSKAIGNGVALAQLPLGASIIGSTLRIPLPALSSNQSGQVSFTLNLDLPTVGASLNPVVAGIQLPGSNTPTIVSDADGRCLSGVIADGSVCSALTTVIAPPVVASDLLIPSIVFNPNPPSAGSSAEIAVNVKNASTIVALEAGGFITVDISKVLNAGITLGQLPESARAEGSNLYLPLPALRSGQVLPIAFPVNLDKSTAGIRLKPIVTAVQLPDATSPAPVSDSEGTCLSGALAIGSVCSATVTVVVPPVNLKDIHVGSIIFNPNPPVAGNSATITIDVTNTNPSVALKSNGYITVDISKVIGVGVSLGSLPPGSNVIGNIIWLPLPALTAGGAAEISFDVSLSQNTVNVQLAPMVTGVQLPETSAPVQVSDADGYCLAEVLADNSVCSASTAIMTPPVKISDLQIAGIYFDPYPPVAGSPTTITLSLRNVSTLAVLEVGGFVTVDLSRVLNSGVGLGSVPNGTIISGSILRLPLPALGTGEIGQVSFTINLSQTTTGIRLNPVVARLQLPKASSSVAASTAGVCLPGVLALGSLCSANVPVVAPPVSIGNLQIFGTYFDPYPPTAGTMTKVTVSLRNTSAVARLGNGGFITLDLSQVVGTNVALGQLPTGASVSGNILRAPLPFLVPGQSKQVSFFLNLGQGATGQRLKPIAAGIQLPDENSPVAVSDADGTCLSGVLAAGSVCSVSVTVAAPPVGINDLTMEDIVFAPNPPVAGNSAAISVKVRNVSASARLETGGYLTVDVSKVIAQGVSLGTLPIGASINGNILWLPMPMLGARQAGEISFTLNLDQSTADTKLTPILAGIQLPGAFTPLIVSDVNGKCLAGVLASGSVCSVTNTVTTPTVRTSDLQLSSIAFNPNTPVAGSLPILTLSVVNTSTTAHLSRGGYLTFDLTKVLGPGVSLGALPAGSSIEGTLLRLPLPALSASQAGQISFALSLSQNTAGIRLTSIVSEIQLPETNFPVATSDAGGMCLEGVLAAGSVCSKSAVVGTSPVRVSDLQITGISFSTSPPLAGSSPTVTVGIRNTNLRANLNYGAFMTIEMNHVLGSGVSLGTLPLGGSITKSMLRLPMPALSSGQSGSVSFPLNIGEGAGGLQLMPVVAGVQLQGVSRPVPISNIEGVCLPKVLYAGSVCSVNVSVAAPPVNTSDVQITGLSFNPSPPVPGSSSTVTIGIKNTNLKSSLFDAFLAVEMNKVLGTGVSLGSLPAGASINRSMLKLPLPLLAAGQTGQVSFQLNVSPSASGVYLTPIVAGLQLSGATMPIPVSNVNGVCLSGILAPGSLCSVTTQVTKSTISLNELQVNSITFSPNVMTAGSQASLQVALRNVSTKANLSSGGFLVLDISKVLVPNVSLKQLPVGATISGSALRLPLPALGMGTTGQITFTIEIGQGAVGRLNPVITGVQLPGSNAPISVSSTNGVCWSGVLAPASVCSTVSAPVVTGFYTNLSVMPLPVLALPLLAAIGRIRLGGKRRKTEGVKEVYGQLNIT